jgi:NAD(P)-dependent dehydrogenase (short-subunit alcohol dehydrogenase family)
MQNLDGKVAVVTGAASGIGLAYCEAFAAAGMRVVLADVELAALEVAAQQVAAMGVDVHPVPTDVTDPTAVEALAAQAFDRFGGAHVVCNNAGVSGTLAPAWELSHHAWGWVLDVNLWGVINGIRTFVPRLIAQGEGHVVNTASAAAYGPLPFAAPYTATKHALLGISECLFHELALLAPTVNVTVVCPGFVRTRINESDRNWPAERLGPAPESNQDMRALFGSLVDAGTAPAELALRVVDAVRGNQFQVVSDADLVRNFLDQRSTFLDGASPAMPTFS